jgi:hypothetical protein
MEAAEVADLSDAASVAAGVYYSLALMVPLRPPGWHREILNNQWR